MKQNKMLKVQNIDLSLLRPWEDNPRINDDAVDSVARSIEHFGFNVPILCNQELVIIAGHTRWKAAKKIGMKSVPVIVLEMTEDQHKAFAVADNKTAEVASWDYPKLRKVLRELKHKKINIPSLGYSKTELQALLTQQKRFDWKVFEEQLKARLTTRYLLLPVKVLAETKESLKKAIRKFADEHGINKKDFAKATGEVLGLLLDCKSEKTINNKGEKHDCIDTADIPKA
ncbi:MAG: ParB N-terminal domain-containing protein [Phycisphaerae bacterium]|jgi:site-specific DNA-methyltransferase (adenine-specific)